MFLPTNITLKFGDSGDFVSELQRRLSVMNCFNESGINGFFDGVTVNGVSQFQSMSGIQADGIAGPETLRRLNGAISGDYSSSDHEADAEAKLREEKAQLILQQQREQAHREEQALIAQQQQERAYQLQMQQQAAAAAAGAPEANLQQSPAYAAPAHHHTPVHTVAPELPQHQAYATSQAHLSQPIHTAAPAAPSASDILAQMLLATQAQPTPQPQPQPVASLQAQPQQPQPTQAPHVAVAAAVAPQQPAQQTYVPAAQTAAAAPVIAPQQAYVPPTAQQVAAAPQQAAQAQAQPQQVAVAPEQPRGVVGRAVQYANQVVQKLASYFEEKLPSHVISEVKEIGQTMAKAGMKEAAIPTGPEPQRGVDTPGKGQSQGKQLG